jgi:hypothetical protein
MAVEYFILMFIRAAIGFYLDEPSPNSVGIYLNHAYYVFYLSLPP